MNKNLFLRHKIYNNRYNFYIDSSKENKEVQEERVRILKEYLLVYNFDKKIRLGINFDGGYVIGDIDIIYDLYISAGVSNEESFSRDFIKKYNLKKNQCYAFDGTIEDYPYEYTNEITFIKKNINSFNDDGNTNLDFLLNNYKNIFIKMDIEGGEYPWILNLTEQQLNNISQITLEFHDITGDEWGANFNDKIKCFNILNSTHYIIHVHGNNYGGLDHKIPKFVELTYINKKLFDEKPQLNKTKLPIIGLDYSNSSSIDYDLNFYPFVN
jgi:hypothetical protein